MAAVHRLATVATSDISMSGSLAGASPSRPSHEPIYQLETALGDE
jgi:hypothetical protein